MTWAIAAAVAAIVGAASSVAYTGYELANQPHAPKPSTAPTPLTKGQNINQMVAAGQTLPNEQSMVGGSVSPDYTAQYAAGQTGVTGNPQAAGNVRAAINQAFGIGAPGTSGLGGTGATAGSNPIEDLIARIRENAGGGSPMTAAGSGDEFKGLAG